MKADVSWGWFKLLQLCDLVRTFFWVNLGNGMNISIWFDNWCSYCPLIRFLTCRDIMREGFSLHDCVIDMVLNDGWKWPQSWLLKPPNLGLVSIPHLVANNSDVPRWRNRDGSFFDFSVRSVWKAIRPCKVEVWKYVRHLMDMDSIQLCFHDIVAYLQPMAKKRTTQSIFGRLIFVASSYFIWIKRDNYLFKKIRRPTEEIQDLIIVTALWKLILLVLMYARILSSRNQVEDLFRVWYSKREFQMRVVLFFPSSRFFTLGFPQEGFLRRRSCLDHIPPYIWMVDVAAWKLSKADWDVS
nr:hypothetical protein [Tanacetum cinerariifolium]